MGRWCSAVAGVCLLILASGCQEHPVTAVEYDSAAVLTGLKTYRWMEESGRITADRAVVEPDLQARIVRAVDAALAARGFVLADGRPADFLVGYHVGLNGRPDVRSMNAYYNYPPGWAWDSYHHGRDLYPKEPEQPTMVLQDRGAVVVDIALPAGGSLVWRGTVYVRVPKARQDDADLDQEWFDQRAQELLANFPPAP